MEVLLDVYYLCHKSFHIAAHSVWTASTASDQGMNIISTVSDLKDILSLKEAVQKYLPLEWGKLSPGKALRTDIRCYTPESSFSDRPLPREYLLFCEREVTTRVGEGLLEEILICVTIRSIPESTRCQRAPCG